MVIVALTIYQYYGNVNLWGLMVTQYGLPEVGIPEDRIATSKYLGCSCGLNHFVACWRRPVCAGYEKMPVTLPLDRISGISASMALILGVFPKAVLITDYSQGNLPGGPACGSRQVALDF